jgi:unsaturated chondroitin disaccharide hydrolase
MYFKTITISSLLFALVLLLRVDVKKNMEHVQQHLRNSLRDHTDTLRFPRTIKDGKTLRTVTSPDWTSGFYAGNLWYMYDYTRSSEWETAARNWTAGLEKEKSNVHTHDLGFMLYCSFGNGYRLTNDATYKDILLEGAKSLCKRYDERVGCIRSWDHGEWKYPVIIDNMMNLELLFWATKVSGDSSFYKIAVQHANTTLKNHFRKDNSSYHVVDYDVTNGSVLAKSTHQGYADESAWARGQAWGLYGFTMAFRETGNKAYLDIAERIANFMLDHPNVPKDKIFYWDFNAPGIPNEERDASAAAITASALLELSQYSNQHKKLFFDAAEKMLASLSSKNYSAAIGTNHNFVLKHSVGHKPRNSEIDVPLIYADYYYIEALLRYQSLSKKR